MFISLQESKKKNKAHSGARLLANGDISLESENAENRGLLAALGDIRVNVAHDLDFKKGALEGRDLALNSQQGALDIEEADLKASRNAKLTSLKGIKANRVKIETGRDLALRTQGDLEINRAEIKASVIWLSQTVLTAERANEQVRIVRGWLVLKQKYHFIRQFNT